MTLQNLQADFLEHIFSDEAQFDAASPKQHLCIYRNNINKVLTDSLSQNYPLICNLLGNDFFAMTAKHYIKQYPSRSPNINEYGEFFSDFLAEFQALRNLVYLPELASFEWACHQINAAADHPPLDIKLLASVHTDQYDNTHFVLHPAIQLFQSHFHILHIIDYCKGDHKNEINHNEAGINLLISRPDADILLEELTEDNYQFLAFLQEGHSLAAALKQALSINPSFNLEENLPKWIENKVIIDCYFSQKENY